MMTTRALITICVTLFTVSCSDTQEASTGEPKDAPPTDLTKQDEVAVIACMLEGYSLGKNGDTPAAFSSLLGTAQAPQLSKLKGVNIEYFHDITESICDDLLEAGAAIEGGDIEIAEEQVSTALASLWRVNQQPVEMEKIGTIAAVPFTRLNQELQRIGRETDSADDWWKEFDKTFPDYAGYASASRVGFSDDGKIAIVYFSWTAGPTLGVGGFHILKKLDEGWQRIGGFPIWTWST